MCLNHCGMEGGCNRVSLISYEFTSNMKDFKVFASNVACLGMSNATVKLFVKCGGLVL